MHRLIRLTSAASVVWFAFGWLTLSWAQPVTNPAPVAIACATNTIPPGTTIGQFYFVQCNPEGQMVVGSTANNTFTTPGCVVGTTETACVSTVGSTHIQVQNTSASANIACCWGSACTPTLNDAGSFMLAPLQPANWGVPTNGTPDLALECIASAAATPMYLEETQ